MFTTELKNKTRVIVTHYLHLLDQVDRVIFMDEGKIMAQGSYEEIKKLESFKIFVQVSQEEHLKKVDEVEEIPLQITENNLVKQLDEDSIIEFDVDEDEYKTEYGDTAFRGIQSSIKTKDINTEVNHSNYEISVGSFNTNEDSKQEPLIPKTAQT